MRVCYLHIGPHKTATSTLQVFLARNAVTLAAHGLHVVSVGRNDDLHHDFANEIVDGRPGKIARRIGAGLINAGLPEKIVLSSECFSRGIRQPVVRARIAAYFAGLGYEVRPIAYIRPQIASVNSFYYQRLKHFVPGERFEQFFARFLQAAQADFLWRFGPLAADRRFRCEFVPFASSVLQGGICADFLKRLEVDARAIDQCELPEPQNVSPGPKAVAGYLWLADHFARDGIEVTRRLCAAGDRVLRQVSNLAGWNGDKFNGLESDQKARLMERFRQANQEFAELVWDRSWSHYFAADEAIALQSARRCFDPEHAEKSERDAFEAACADAHKLIVNPAAPTRTYLPLPRR